MKKLSPLLLVSLSLTTPAWISATFEDPEDSASDTERGHPSKEVSFNRQGRRAVAARETQIFFRYHQGLKPLLEDYGFIIHKNFDSESDEATKQNFTSSSFSRMISSSLHYFEKPKPHPSATYPPLHRRALTATRDSIASSHDDQGSDSDSTILLGSRFSSYNSIVLYSKLFQSKHDTG